jgi:hypothetical protein
MERFIFDVSTPSPKPRFPRRAHGFFTHDPLDSAKGMFVGIVSGLVLWFALILPLMLIL